MNLPLDRDRYRDALVRLRELVEEDPELTDVGALRDFVVEHRSWFGPRTAQATREAPPERLRMAIHVMVLAASELAPLHDRSRVWLSEHGHALPPWDVTVPRIPQRLITFGGRVYGAVEWEPERRVELAPQLDEAERRWATALAVGLGECPQWTEAEVARYAAYLVMGVEEFAAEREFSDGELALRYGVPVAAVRHRRGLPDEV